MAHKSFKLTALALVGLGIWVGTVRADKAQLEERLKQELSIKLENVTISQALEQIGEKGGVKITLSPAAVWKLPEGQDTRVSVALEGRLSESLEKMLNNFFLRYAVGSDSLTIYTRPELKHIIGRPTADELRLLRNIYSNKMWLSIGAGVTEISDRFVQEALNGMAQEPVAVMPADESRAIANVMQRMATKSSSSSGRTGAHDANAPKGTPVTMALLLEGVEQSGSRPQWTWYIQGPEFPREVSEIRIVTREEFWQAHLDQIMDVSFSNQTGEAIIGQLAAWGDLTVQFRGGQVPEALARTMTLEVQNARLIDVLDRAVSVLGVVHGLNLSEGVVEVYQIPMLAPMRTGEKETTQPTPTETVSGTGYVGKISIPMDGGRYFIEFMLRESDLTEELRQLRQQKVRQILEELSQTALEEKK